MPVSTVRPARMIDTRSHSASTSARMWLDSSTVRPRRFSSSMHSRKTSSISGSRPDVGSSSSSSSTSDASAATSATFCRLPFEYVRAFLRGSRSNRSSRASRRLVSTRRAGGRAGRSPRRRTGSARARRRPERRRAGGAASRRRATGRRRGAAALPPSARIRPSRMRRVVDFPAPFGPRNPCTSPVATCRSRPSSAVVEPKRLVSPSTTMAGPAPPAGLPGPSAGLKVVMPVRVRSIHNFVKLQNVVYSPS